LRTCSKCNLEKPAERYPKKGNQCKDCINAYSRELIKNNPEYAKRRRESVKKWMLENPEAYKLRQRYHHLKREWNMSLDEYNAMLEKQNGVCAICKKPELSTRGRATSQSLAVDHCHETGKIRELLCMDCNQTLGKFNDDPSWFIAASEYLIKHGKVTV